MSNNLILYTCPECGQRMMLSKYGGRKSCPDCARNRRLEADRQRMRRYREEARVRRRAQASEAHLGGESEIIRENQAARAAGLSYGQYIALREREGKK